MIRILCDPIHGGDTIPGISDLTRVGGDDLRGHKTCKCDSFDNTTHVVSYKRWLTDIKPRWEI